ncbi:type II toxin-antitoxin system RelE/ParE family toxin [Rheinheimera baltica]|uniref:type II toxin-antitoxin system RelE/ParE family toxin n=1 Tax=Rheinheimera baltica TaxID=67576 RepID=UPI00273DC74E|nr:type II toxin-antitoxin system RelE/ParE family toxin [Rheinheimera baltica]MDP5142643.1 type II toxin-antitoxin system RelE/ParE family toxin [Rheinheimera baltica]
MAYILSNKAEEDIIAIFVTGAEQFGLIQAQRYHQQLTTTFEFLSDNPQAAPVREELIPPVRLHPVGLHLVIYQLEDDNSIFIIRVRLAHEDWLNTS